MDFDPLVIGLIFVTLPQFKVGISYTSTGFKETNIY